MDDPKTIESQLATSSVDMIYKLNLEGYFTYVNHRLALFFDTDPQKLKGIYFTELVREDWRIKTQEFYVKQLENRIPSTYFEFPVIDIDGKKKWVGQSAEIIFDNGEPIEVLAVARDITDKKEVEEELEKADSRIHTIVTNLLQQMETFLLPFINRITFPAYFLQTYIRMRFCQIM